MIISSNRKLLSVIGGQSGYTPLLSDHRRYFNIVRDYIGVTVYCCFVAVTVAVLLLLLMLLLLEGRGVVTFV